jgi:hypothetical protein
MTSELESRNWKMAEGNLRRFLVASFGFQGRMSKTLRRPEQKTH